MVDHSRGVVSWVKPTMQLNRHIVSRHNMAAIQNYVLVLCGLRFEAGTILKMTVIRFGEDDPTRL